ncbi:hypothetical protein KL86APRO_30189 [uncultured Alphaproteobacteria bacterium]|uniref:Uncharacterized protein n=1 Tax=uncultured Alphaproteobacteria bacterium TaxID=91750 RepID=A0A212KM11_9PROT|nr:hypothetical protein KL86APRO_30189 [uncultured Alphaproteobacteria bacterium]
MEPGNRNDGRKDETNIRLGIDYDLRGIDPEYVQVFAKTYRIIGLIIVVSFVAWGLFYDFQWGRSPFEMLFREFGVGRQNREVAVWVFAAAITVSGFYLRFIIGAVLSAAVFKLWDVIKVLVIQAFRKI